MAHVACDVDRSEYCWSLPLLGERCIDQESAETPGTGGTGFAGVVLLHLQGYDPSPHTVEPRLATILQRQKQLGMAINNELAQHIELLDGLSDDMERVGGKLTAAKKQLNRLG